MALTHITALRDTWANALDDEVNGGGGAGEIRFGTSGFGVVVATMALEATAFGASSSGVITLAATPKEDTNANAGTMAEFDIRDNAAVIIVDGSVSTAGADINFNSVIVSAGQTVELTSLTWTAPA
jgi:hypothetical protein